MDTTAPPTTVIRLRRAEDLFESPVFDWRCPPTSLLPGMVTAIARMESASSPPQPMRIRFEFTEPLPPDANEDLRTGFFIYCVHQIMLHRTQAADIRRKGWRALLRGLLALALALGLSALFSSLHMLPWLNETLSTGLMIVGFVTLWYPLELLIYSSAGHARQAQLLTRLANSEVEFSLAY